MNEFTELVGNVSGSGLAETPQILDTPIGGAMYFTIGFVVLMVVVPLFIAVVRYAKKNARVSGGSKRRITVRRR